MQLNICWFYTIKAHTNIKCAKVGFEHEIFPLNFFNDLCVCRLSWTRLSASSTGWFEMACQLGFFIDFLPPYFSFVSAPEMVIARTALGNSRIDNTKCGKGEMTNRAERGRELQGRAGPPSISRQPSASASLHFVSKSCNAQRPYHNRFRFRTTDRRWNTENWYASEGGSCEFGKENDS